MTWDVSLIKALLPADCAVTVFTLIDLLAGKKTKGDDRVIGERRADALSDVFHQLLTHGHIDLRGLLEPTDTNDHDHIDGIDDIDSIDDIDDEDSSDDDQPDPTTSNRNGPVTSNCDWPDDNLDTATGRSTDNHSDTPPTPQAPDPTLVTTPMLALALEPTPALALALALARTPVSPMATLVALPPAPMVTVTPALKPCPAHPDTRPRTTRPSRTPPHRQAVPPNPQQRPRPRQRIQHRHRRHPLHRLHLPNPRNRPRQIPGDYSAGRAADPTSP